MNPTKPMPEVVFLRTFKPSSNGRCFHVRENNGSFQVHGTNLEHVCSCETLVAAKTIAAALEITAVMQGELKDAK